MNRAAVGAPLALVLAACSAGAAGDPPAGDTPRDQRGTDAQALHGRGILLVRPHSPVRPARERGPGRVPLVVGGETRGLLYLPAPRAGRPPGLLLLLHGARGGAEWIIPRFEPAAEQLGLIVVAPESRGRTWDVIEGKAFGPDVAAIDEALEVVFEQHAVDGERVAVAGFSDGATYALSLGVGNGQLFRAIIAFSPGYTAATRVAGRPRVFISHGTSDSVLPIDQTSRRIVPLLERLGLEVRYVEFPGDHEMPEEIRAAGLALVAPR
jgi:phospholipase/carboxylesterase